MTTKNDITGDLIKTKGSTEEYRNNYDRIFGKKTEQILSVVKEFRDHAKNVQTILDEHTTILEYNKKHDIVQDDVQIVPFDKHPGVSKGYDGKTDIGTCGNPCPSCNTTCNK